MQHTRSLALRSCSVSARKPEGCSLLHRKWRALEPATSEEEVLAAAAADADADEDDEARPQPSQ